MLESTDSNHVSLTKLHSHSTITTTHVSPQQHFPPFSRLHHECAYLQPYLCDRGFFQPHHHPFLWDTNPSLGDGSSLGDFINVHHCYPVMLAPNNNALHDCHKDKVIWDFHNKSWFIHLKLLPPNHHHLFLSLVIMDG